MCLFLCVCIKAQEDVEVAGCAGKQGEFSPAIFLGTAEAGLHAGSSPRLSRAPQQLQA